VVWDPLAAAIGEADRVLVVPDADLQLVNLATLPVDDGRYLVETDLVIHTVSAERDLVAVGEPAVAGRGLLALGSPDFDASPGPPPPVDPPAAATRVSRAGLGALGAGERYRGAVSSCGDFRDHVVPPLPAAREEVEEIAALWQSSADADPSDVSDVLTLTGAGAHEATLKRLARGRRVLHLATHGFFLGGQCSALGSEGSRDVGGATPPLGDNPLLLSGLALAGFNRRATAGEGVEDGVLTAEEIASMDLRGVDWVVLSACETGLGEVQPREGVFGLRRAFRVAGAGTLIMSLWSVQDESAREWMRHLYTGRSTGLSTADAVRRAGATMIEARRRKGRSTHPFYWGAFVAAGDWR
jgi:CHAT domain-containing protein